MDALPSFDDQADFESAGRGFVGTAPRPEIRDASGRVVWDLDAYAFLDAACPDTANPSLWRQSRLTAMHGLYQVADGIYQVRGFDLSNISFIEGDRGVIVVDPLLSTECAAAALSLYREHRGDRPVSAVIYSHSHADHFGGVRGAVPDAADIPVVAPAGFLEHAVSENVYAGTAMNRRAIFMYGAELPKDATGQIGAGLGPTTSLRMLNQGYTGIEIAEMMRLPPALEQAWHARGYYGSVSHNVKAIYQRYMGWFDGNPAHLWELPPEESAKKHVEYMGGAQTVLPKARVAFEAGETRWAAQVLNYVVFADPDDTEARELLAQVYDALGQGSENGTWRNFYLQGAAELRGDKPANTLDSSSPDVAMALSVEQVFDSLAIRVNGPRAWDTRLTIDWNFTDLKEEVRLSLANGVLTQTRAHDGTPADLTLTLTKPQMFRAISAQSLDGVQADGDRRTFATLIGLLDDVDRDFDIVTP